MAIIKGVKAKEEGHTDPLRCGHCGNVVSMRTEGSYAVPRDTGVFPRCTVELLSCTTCREPTLREAGVIGGGGSQVLYPRLGLPRGLPDEVARALDSATKVKAVDANSYGVSVGRVLSLVCDQQGAKPGTLFIRLNELVQKGKLPEAVGDIAHQVRDLRNVGAHTELGELSEEQVPLIEGLTLAILEYVYAAPLLVQEARECIAKLKGKR